MIKKILLDVEIKEKVRVAKILSEKQKKFGED